MLIVLLNGPPRCGKDTLAKSLRALGTWKNKTVLQQFFKFASELKRRTHALYGLDVPEDHYENVKDLPHSDFMGLTPRKAYIEVSENHFKRLHGQDVFGQILAKVLAPHSNMPNHVVAISDSGFVPEAAVLVNKFGAANILLVRIERPGTSFVGDSRNYISLEGVRTIDVMNDATDAPMRIAKQIMEAL